MKSEARLERLREGGISVDEFIDKFVYTYEAEEKAEERAQEEAQLQKQRSMQAAAEGDWGSSGSEGGERQQVAQVEQQPQVRVQGQARWGSMPKRPPRSFIVQTPNPLLLRSRIITSSSSSKMPTEGGRSTTGGATKRSPLRRPAQLQRLNLRMASRATGRVGTTSLNRSSRRRRRSRN